MKRGSERKIWAAQRAADILEKQGFAKEAEDVRSLCRSNAALRNNSARLHADNIALREGRA